MKTIDNEEELLYDLYINQQKTWKEIANFFGCSSSTVGNKLKKYNLTPEMQEANKPQIKLTPLQHDIMIGSYLGDGTFTKQHKNGGTHMGIVHAEDQKKYCEMKLKLLQNLVNKTELTFRDRKNTDKDDWNRQDQYVFTTRTLPCLNYYYGRSIIETLNELNENSLAIWFLDDGHHKVPSGKNKNSYYEITATRFTENEVLHTLKVLKEKFDIIPHIKRNKKGKPIFVFNIYDSYKMSQMFRKSELGLLIEEYIPYKLIDKITFNRVVKAEKFTIPIEHA